MVFIGGMVVGSIFHIVGASRVLLAIISVIFAGRSIVVAAL